MRRLTPIPGVPGVYGERGRGVLHLDVPARIAWEREQGFRFTFPDEARFAMSAMFELRMKIPELEGMVVVAHMRGLGSREVELA